MVINESEAYERYRATKQMYYNNDKFHTFVNKVCNSYKYDIEFCFNIKTVQDVGEYYAGLKDASELGPVNLDICECEAEDKSC